VHLEAGGPQPVAEEVTLGAQRVAELGVELVTEAEAPGDGGLERCSVHIGEELLGGAHGRHQIGWAADPADLPSREAEGLAGRADREGALGHPRERGERPVLTVEDEVLVHLVGDRDEIPLDAEARDRPELGGREDLAGGVVRRVEEQESGAVGDERGQCVDVRLVGGRA
jgi:hypothetical protein